MMPRHPDGDVRLDAGYESGAQGEAQAGEIIKVSPLKGKRLMGLGREEGVSLGVILLGEWVACMHA